MVYDIREKGKMYLSWFINSSVMYKHSVKKGVGLKTTALIDLLCTCNITCLAMAVRKSWNIYVLIVFLIWYVD
jgi:hypothetical protein